MFFFSRATVGKMDLRRAKYPDMEYLVSKSCFFSPLTWRRDIVCSLDSYFVDVFSGWILTAMVSQRRCLHQRRR